MRITKYIPTYLTILFVSLLSANFTWAANDQILRDILRSYTRALGELADIRNLTSYKIKGETLQEGKTYSFSYYKKAPNLLRHELSFDGRNVIQIFDGSAGWQWFPDAEKVEPTVLNVAQIDFMEKEAAFEPPLIAYKRLGREIEFIGRTSIVTNLYPVFHIRLTDTLGGGREDIFIDSRNYYEVRRLSRASANETPLETIFSDFQKIKGFPVPFTIKNYLEGELVSTTELTDVELNIGILNFYFKKPE